MTDRSKVPADFDWVPAVAAWTLSDAFEQLKARILRDIEHRNLSTDLHFHHCDHASGVRAAVCSFTVMWGKDSLLYVRHEDSEIVVDRITMQAPGRPGTDERLFTIKPTVTAEGTFFRMASPSGAALPPDRYAWEVSRLILEPYLFAPEIKL